MEISSITDAYLNQMKTQYETDEKKTQSFATALDSAAKNKNDAELLEACREFESYFINFMFKEMRKTVDDSSSFIKKSNAEKIFQEMLDEQVSISSANSGGIGLAAFMYQQMKRQSQA